MNKQTINNYYILFFLLIYSFLGYSQFGPAGVGDNTSNGLWLRAEDIAGADGDAIAAWQDFSGNANNANQATANKQPLYYSTSAMNNMPIVRLDGTNDEMAVADADILDGTTGLTYYAAIRPTNLNGTPRGILGKRENYYTATNYAYSWFFYNSSYLYLDINTTNNRFNTNPTTFTNNTNYILGFDFDGNEIASQRSRIFSNGALVTVSTETSTTVPNSNQDLAIGALNVDYGSYLGADYAEIIQFNYSLDTTEHLLVQNYLSAKYNTALNANDLYDEDDNGDYDFEVAGIGQYSTTTRHDDSQGSAILRINNPTALDSRDFLIWGHDNGVEDFVETADIPATVSARFDRVWRASEVLLGTLLPADVGAIDMSWDLSALGAYAANDVYLLVDTDNDGTFADETPFSGATDLGGNLFQFAAVTAIENNLRFTLAYYYNPLPVELTSFTAQVVDDYVNLNWMTASEVNNDYFTLQKSQNATDWTNVTTVQGQGNSSIETEYSYIDRFPYNGTSYYRLVQTDFDGTSTNSDIRKVTLESNELLAYPNPVFDDWFYIEGEIGDSNSIQIYASNGQNVTQKVDLYEWTNEKVTLNVSELNPGLYIIQLKTTSGIQQLKLIVK